MFGCFLRITGIAKTGIPPNFQRRGEQPTLVPRLRVGPKTLANPQPTGGGQNGGGGSEAPSQGVWGMCPQNFQVRGELPTLATPPRVGPKTLANPQLTRVGKKGGPGGRSSHGRGSGGCAFSDLTPWSPSLRGKGENFVGLSGKPTSGTQNVGEPSANEGGKWGVRGAKPPWRGAWGVSPHKTLKGGKQPTLATGLSSSLKLG